MSSMTRAEKIARNRLARDQDILRGIWRGMTKIQPDQSSSAEHKEFYAQAQEKLVAVHNTLLPIRKDLKEISEIMEQVVAHDTNPDHFNTYIVESMRTYFTSPEEDYFHYFGDSQDFYDEATAVEIEKQPVENAEEEEPFALRSFQEVEDQPPTEWW